MSGLLLVMGFSVLFPLIGALLITLCAATLAGMVAGTAILLAELGALIAATVAPIKAARIAARVRRWSETGA